MDEYTFKRNRICNTCKRVHDLNDLAPTQEEESAFYDEEWYCTKICLQSAITKKHGTALFNGS